MVRSARASQYQGMSTYLLPRMAVGVAPCRWGGFARVWEHSLVFACLWVRMCFACVSILHCVCVLALVRAVQMHPDQTQKCACRCTALPVPDPWPCEAYVSPLCVGLYDCFCRRVYFFISRETNACMTCGHAGCARHATTRACSKRGPSADKGSIGLHPIPLYDFVGGQNVGNYYTHATQHLTTIMWPIPLYDFICCQNVSFYT